MAYGLGVDLGTTFTAAAVSDATGTRTVPLGRDVTVSSVVFAAEDGALITGDDAEQQVFRQPGRVSHAHKRRLGDPAPLTLAGVARSPASLMAAQLRDVVGAVTKAAGDAPRSVVLTCPAVWGPYRREHFAEVPRLAGLRDVRIITEPEAAAMHYSVERRLGEGELVAVYDLGGGTFDATILRARHHGMEILGTPEGIERMGGIEIDDTLLAHVDDRLNGKITALDRTDPDDARVLAAVREVCRQAKEELSTEPDTIIRVPLPGTPEVTLSRIEFNDLIRPLLNLTVEAMTRTITGAGLRQDDLAGILLAGGSSRIPLVGQVVSETFGKPVRVGLHPKLTVALGAAAIARTEAARARREAPVLPPPAAGVVPGPRPSPNLIAPVRFMPAPPPPVHTAPLVRRAITGARKAPLKRWLPVAAAAIVLLLGTGAIAATVINIAPPATQASTPQADQTPVSAHHPQDPVFFTNGQDVAPFLSRIGSDAGWEGTSLSADGTAAQPGISVRKAGVGAEADGRQVVWTGTGAAQFYLQYPRGRQDARPYLDSGALAFEVVVTKAPSSEVSLAMHCHHPCASEVSAASLFRKLPAGQKTTVRIPLACFNARGFDPANVDVPFLVHTKGAFEATFARIRWESDAAKDAGTTPCTDLN